MRKRLVTLIAMAVIFTGSLFLTEPIAVAELTNICCASNGACCYCSGACGANSGQCWCNAQ